MTSKLTQEEMDRLLALNTERAPLQERLLSEAERLFDIWDDLNPLNHGSRYFKRAELEEFGIRIEFESGCSCGGHDYDRDETTLPIEAFLSSEWEEQAKATIAERAAAKRRAEQARTERSEREQLAALQKKYPNAR